MTQLYKSQRCHWHRCATNFVDLLRKYEALLKKALTRVSGALGELFDEKNRGRKSCVIVPLTMNFSHNGAKNSLGYTMCCTKYLIGKALNPRLKDLAARI
jgi:hypothetical protein